MIKEKNNFIFGLVTGVAVVSLIGFIVMSVAYLKKGGLNDSNESGQVAQEDSDVKPSPTPSPSPAPAPSPSQPANIQVSDSDHMRGNKDALVTIVEYSDFQCPFCFRFHNTLEQVMAAYPNDVRWVYRHFPLDRIHPYARQAAQASECANDQGKFWEYNDGLYANQSLIKPDYFGQLAKELGLNTVTFDKCLSDGKYVSKVNDDYLEGQGYGVTGTPGSFINGQKLGGAVPFEQLKTMIDNLLK